MLSTISFMQSFQVLLLLEFSRNKVVLFLDVPSHLFDGAVFRLRWPYSPLIEEVEGDEKRGAQGSHGGGQGDGDVPEENHMCVEGTGRGSGPENRGRLLPGQRHLTVTAASFFFSCSFTLHVRKRLRLFLFRDAFMYCS